MLDRARAKKHLKYTDLNREMQANDLIAIEDIETKVHIVFTDNASICRPSILKGGTERREKRTWEILGSVRDLSEYRRAVTTIERQPCKRCLARYK
jgi:hypothetical protein